jgi:hypothetical protein
MFDGLSRRAVDRADWVLPGSGFRNLRVHASARASKTPTRYSIPLGRRLSANTVDASGSQVLP